MIQKDITIIITDRADKDHELVIPSDCGMNLMEICKAAELPVEGTCGGMALCGSCHIFKISAHKLPPPTIDEEIMLDQLPGIKHNSRLACQIKITIDLDQLKVVLAPIN